MPKTNQIAGKATSLESKIEDLNPGSACPAPTKNENKNTKILPSVDSKTKVKGQHKGQKKFCIFISQDIIFIFLINNRLQS